MIWKLFELIPVAGPIVATIGKFISIPVAKMVCWISSQPDHVVNAACVGLAGIPCK